MAMKRMATATKLNFGTKTVSSPGEEMAADLWVVKQFGEQWLMAVIDGLGHGPEALKAAETARGVIEMFEGQPHPATILTECSAAMTNTRGAVIGLCLVDYGRDRLTWSGVGNIEGKVVWRETEGQLQQVSLISTPGIVGCDLPKLNQQVCKLKPASLIIMFTDGLDSKWVFPENRWLFEMEPEALAAHLMKSHSKKTDDSLVAVVRY